MIQRQKIWNWSYFFRNQLYFTFALYDYTFETLIYQTKAKNDMFNITGK